MSQENPTDKEIDGFFFSRTKEERAADYQFQTGFETAYRGFVDLILPNTPASQREAFAAGTKAGAHERGLDMAQGRYDHSKEIGC